MMIHSLAREIDRERERLAAAATHSAIIRLLSATLSATYPPSQSLRTSEPSRSVSRSVGSSLPCVRACMPACTPTTPAGITTPTTPDRCVQLISQLASTWRPCSQPALHPP
eukprot:GHVU01195973.1.p1 GENE.GHVU01195973.1~~GHVU01195973.1.p1  ORF type:complete len:111 (+),score=3.83 GHVU01195973.1:108-440(+)